MELKLKDTADKAIPLSTFNRTSMELKRRKESFGRVKLGLLIGPVWN